MPGQKHHYVPVFYLRQWAGADGRLCEFSRPHATVRPRMKHPDATGYVRGLYTMDGVADALADVFENRFLSIADGTAALALRIMLDRNVIPPPREKAAWARFILTLWHRTPEGVARLRERIEQFYAGDEESRRVYANLRRPSDPETLEAFIDLDRRRMTSESLTRLMLNIMQSEYVATRIMNMSWHVGKLTGFRYKLLTSDRPIVMTNGIGHDRSHIIMPLSSEHWANTILSVERLLRSDAGSGYGLRIARAVFERARDSSVRGNILLFMRIASDDPEDHRAFIFNMLNRNAADVSLVMSGIHALNTFYLHQKTAYHLLVRFLSHPSHLVADLACQGVLKSERFGEAVPQVLSYIRKCTIADYRSAFVGRASQLLGNTVQDALYDYSSKRYFDFKKPVSERAIRDWDETKFERFFALHRRPEIDAREDRSDAEDQALLLRLQRLARFSRHYNLPFLLEITRKNTTSIVPLLEALEGVARRVKRQWSEYP